MLYCLSFNFLVSTALKEELTVFEVGMVGDKSENNEKRNYIKIFYSDSFVNFFITLVRVSVRFFQKAFSGQ